MQAVNGCVAFADRHLRRLTTGMRVLHLETAPITLRENAKQLVEANGNPELARLRLSVWRARGGAFAPETNASHWLLESAPLNAPIEAFPAPITATIYDELRINPGRLSGIKSLNSLPYVLAAHFAQTSGADEALLLNAQDRAAEFSASNLFAVVEGRLYTPPESEGCLPGVTRGFLLDISEKVWGSGVSIEPLTLEQLATASEIFCTNAIKGPRAVASVYSLAYAPNKNFPVARKAREAWRNAVICCQE